MGRPCRALCCEEELSCRSPPRLIVHFGQLWSLGKPGFLLARVLWLFLGALLTPGHPLWQELTLFFGRGQTLNILSSGATYD